METLVFESGLGHVALARRGETVLALTFGHSSQRSAIKALGQRMDPTSAKPVEALLADGDCGFPVGDWLVERLGAFAEGTACDFDDVDVDLTGLTPFGRAIVGACRSIPWGETATYGELADAVGRPRAARAVGSVMAQNRVPLIIPCHRIVPASGGLGGFSAPQGVAMKRRLLALEKQTACC